MRKESSRHSKQCCTHKSGLNLKVPYFFKWASLVALVVKNPPASARDIRDAGSTPGLRRSPRRGCGNPLQHFYLENPTDRGAYRQQSIGLQRVDTTERLHFHFHFRNKTVFWAELLHISRQAFAPDIKKNAR